MKNAILAFTAMLSVYATHAWAGYPEAVAAAAKGDYVGAYEQFSHLGKVCKTAST